MSATAVQQHESLNRAKYGQSAANYAAIFAGFEAKGIPASDILPRENVFTFNAWRAQGRSVRKGEHGVKCFTWIPTTKTKADGTKSDGKICRTVTVFHVSQTDASN